MKSAGVCLSRRNKEAILHSSDKCVPPFSERKWDGGKSVYGLQTLMLSEHPEVLGDRGEDKIAVTSSLLGKISIGSSQQPSANWNEGFAFPY